MQSVCGLCAGLAVSHEVSTLSPTDVAEKDPPDLLNKKKCLEYLAALRHAKWFQVCVCVRSVSL